ncbi:MAG: energy transducer TonB [Holophagaceae bacterium]|nr:energy transducer TonB [Holophagaceae bacterium]
MRIALSLLLIALPLAAAKRPTAAQLQAQVKRLTEERDDLKQRLAATEDLQKEIGSARKARDLAKAETESARKETEQLRATLRENQGGSDAILKDLQEAKQAAAEARAEAIRLKTENEALQLKTAAIPSEGDLVQLAEDIQPARAINLNRATPRLKAAGFFAGRPKGVVVVHVLISEKGDVLAARLIQGLPGDSAEAREAGEACVEAAKHLVFDPAASKDGKTKFKVWQGVGFYLD